VTDVEAMREALRLARQAGDAGEVPVGAVAVCDGRIVGRGRNRREEDADPVAHAELMAVREAARTLGRWRLTGVTVYATLEPCAMCAGALVNARVERLVYGASDPKAGFCGSLGDLVRDPRLNHRLVVTHSVLEQTCSGLLKDFFAGLRRGRAVPSPPEESGSDL